MIEIIQNLIGAYVILTLCVGSIYLSMKIWESKRRLDKNE